MGCFSSKAKVDDTSTSRVDKLEELRVKPGTFVTINEKRFQEVYQLGKSLGAGGHGEVRFALHRSANTPRAVKIFRKDVLTSVESKQKLITEINVLKALDHPNVVRVYEFFEDPKRFYMVMEQCKGGELFQEILKKGRFRENQAAQVMEQLFSCVAYLHDNNIIHRDLKPENILLEEKGDFMNIKLIDFGTATFFDNNGTITGTMGTAYYIAPEVVFGTYNEACDIWSCGVILYILLSGEPPFKGDNDEEIIENVKQGKYEFPSKNWSNVSDQAKQLINSLLCPVSKRLTASEALNHEWFSISLERSAPSFELMKSALNNLKEFHNLNKFQDAVQTFITTQCLSAQDTKEVRAVFREMDKNGDGQLSKEELLRYFNEILGIEDAQEEVDRVMKKVDTDYNGYIGYTEFIKASLDPKKVLTRENIGRAFIMFDKDESGSISADELKKVLEGGSSSSKKVWLDIIKEVDQDGDGEIDLREFEDIVMSKI